MPYIVLLHLLIYGAMTSYITSGCRPSEVPSVLSTEFDPLEGPQITFNPYAKPFALVPFPNDATLRVSAETLTGKSWNVSMIKSTEHERTLRADFNQLEGFGPFAPILVTFEGPLALETLLAEHVKLVNIEPGHHRYGEEIPIDFGDGFFPSLTEAHLYYEYDEHAETPSLVLPRSSEVSEGKWVNYYDHDSRTLILRPIIPLAQGARYAVLLSREIQGIGARGELGAIQSPFPAKAHLSQLDYVQEALKTTGWREDQLAFGWTYTTMNVTRPLELVRKGLYGEGRFSPYRVRVPPVIKEVRDTSIEHDSTINDQPQDPRDHRFILKSAFLSEIFKVIGQVQGDDNFAIEMPDVDYFVFGSFESPQIRNPETAKIDVNWRAPKLIDAQGTTPVERVPFIISIPKTTERFKPPFPVMFYFHGTGTSRFEAAAISNRLAQQGVAVFSFDQVGHGPLLQDLPRLIAESDLPPAVFTVAAQLVARLFAPERADELIGLDPIEAFSRLEDNGLFAEITVHGRAYDEDKNGVLEIAEGFFHADPFKMCGSFLQDLVDFMQAVRLVRGLSADQVPSALEGSLNDANYDTLREHLLSGDFNADGVLDLGGPGVQFSVAGTSLGGIHSVMAAAIEPEVEVVTPIVAGGGLAHLISRTTLHFILEDVFKETFGAMVIGCPVLAEAAEDVSEDQLYLLLGSQATRCNEKGIERAFAQLSLPPVGSKVKLSSPSHDESVEVELDEERGFVARIPIDQGELIQVTITDPQSGETPQVFDVRADIDGSAYARNSSDFWRALTLEQHALDRCDPSNFARHLFWEPLEGHQPKSVLFLNAVADSTVPISDGILLGVASGIFGQREEEWRPVVEDLIDRDIMRGDVVDVHGILRGTEWERAPSSEESDEASSEPYGLFTPVSSGDGISSMHIADVNGKHEWIAGFTTSTGFEYGTYSQNQLSVFHACGGKLILNEPVACLSTNECEAVINVDQHDACQHVSSLRERSE